MELPSSKIAVAIPNRNDNTVTVTVLSADGSVDSTETLSGGSACSTPLSAAWVAGTTNLSLYCNNDIAIELPTGL